MKVTAYYILLVNWLSSCLCRGPHHPHGHPAVDHHHHHHHHYKPISSESLTRDAQLLHDTKHLKEDTKILTAEALAKMTPEELEFHYFSSHDYDKNSKLDGLEMLKAVYHTIEHAFPTSEDDVSIEPEAEHLETFVAIVDRTLASDDTDGDGFVSYLEYRAARINNSEDRTPRILNSPS